MELPFALLSRRMPLRSPLRHAPDRAAHDHSPLLYRPVLPAPCPLILPTLVTAMLLISCADSPTDLESVASVSVFPDHATIPVGDSLQLTATVKDAAGNMLLGRVVTWASGNQTVAAVSPSGLVVGVAVGSAAIVATSEGQSDTATITVTPGTLVITAGPTELRQGDVVTYSAEGHDADGAPISEATLSWSVAPNAAGFFGAHGEFVGYLPGRAAVIVSAPGLADTLPITIQPRSLSGAVTVVGQGTQTARFTSDLWVHGSYAYTGAFGGRSEGGDTLVGRIFVWDISDPSSPSLTDSVVVDATKVNDVKVRADGAVAVLTHEGSSDGLNGITLLDLSDPAHPSPITRFTTSLEWGVHNVWIESEFVYAAVDGIGGLRVIDISVPTNPRMVASFYAESSFLHDVYVRDGLAFLSHWDAGLIILDVGNGVAGGAPSNPVEVSRIGMAGGQTHNAWYWPATGYVFVGEEDFGTPGIMHIVDVRDLSNPREVATFRVPGAPPHNFWLDEKRGVLYLAWYQNGIRVLDVSGTLLGELDRQGREIASLQYAAEGECFRGAATCTWAPQLHDGLLYISDVNSGLWVLRPSF